MGCDGSGVAASDVDAEGESGTAGSLAGADSFDAADSVEDEADESGVISGADGAGGAEAFESGLVAVTLGDFRMRLRSAGSLGLGSVDWALASASVGGGVLRSGSGLGSCSSGGNDLGVGEDDVGEFFGVPDLIAELVAASGDS